MTAWIHHGKDIGRRQQLSSWQLLTLTILRRLMRRWHQLLVTHLFKIFETVKTHAHMRTHLLAHICFHIELLGLYMPIYGQVAFKPPCGAQPWLYTAWQVQPADHGLPAESLWLFQFFFLRGGLMQPFLCIGTMRHEVIGLKKLF